jgi:hypothetical protein
VPVDLRQKNSGNNVKINKRYAGKNREKVNKMITRVAD